MPNLASALKAEITRISRKEIKASLSSLHRATVNLRKTTLELKRKIAVLESENKRLLAAQSKLLPDRPDAQAVEAETARITARGIRTVRGKLGLSQEAFARLLGVSSQAVFAMEHRPGRVRLRSATLGKFLEIRRVGKREASRMLEQIEGQPNGNG